jgi:phasin family protein
MAEKTVMDMFADTAKQISLPKIDYEAFLDIDRKNIEAMQTSAAVVSEGGRAVLAKQREILAEVGREAQQPIADFKPGGSPQEVAAKQAGLAKRAFDATAKNTRDVAELIQKSNSEAPWIILDRMRESFAEARAAIESRKAWYATSAGLWEAGANWLCCNAGDFGGAGLRDPGHDFSLIRLALTGPKVRTGGRCETSQLGREAVADTELRNV